MGRAPSCRKASWATLSTGAARAWLPTAFLSTCSPSEVRVHGGLTMARPPRALVNQQNSGTHTCHQLPWKALWGRSAHRQATKGSFLFLFFLEFFRDQLNVVHR